MLDFLRRPIIRFSATMREPSKSIDIAMDRSEEGRWAYKSLSDTKKAYSAVVEATPRYMTNLDPAFTYAREKSEWEFLLCLLRITGMEDPGWDPYETTLRSIPKLIEIHNQLQDHEAQRHLQLWIYGHILEASSPYEILANLIDVSMGGRFLVLRFKPNEKGRPPSPNSKIKSIQACSERAKMPSVSIPLEEAWSRDLRNAVFHSDYSFHGGELRTLNPTRVYSNEEVTKLVNRAVAYHHALSALHRFHIKSYEEPKVIPVPESFSGLRGSQAVVIVRQKHGAVGLRATPEQVARGAIPFLLGRFSAKEYSLLNNDPTLALLPARGP